MFNQLRRRDYYPSAPGIIRSIEQRGKGEVQWPNLFGMIQAAVKHIDAGSNANALGVYAAEYLRLKGLYIPSNQNIAPLNQAAPRLAGGKLRALRSMRAAAHPNVAPLRNAVDAGHSRVRSEAPLKFPCQRHIALFMMATLAIAGCVARPRAEQIDPRQDLAMRLKHDVTALASLIGVRDNHHSAQANEAARYIEAAFRKQKGTVTVQPYEVEGVTHYNVCLEVPGLERSGEIVVVGAHYDTAVDTPGADDNASGVAALLELASRFAAQPSARTVRFVAFGTEEPPYIRTSNMGSYHYARMCREKDENIVAMISLEMIGYYSDAPGSQKAPMPLASAYPTVGNFLVFVGDTSAGQLVRRSRDLFTERCGIGAEVMVLPRYIRGVNSSDQWSFWQWKYPGIMVTDTAHWRNPNYHMPGDTPEKLDYGRMAQALAGLEAVLREWAA